ncbi:uncharacterized protein KQ657_004476 [Scheffersomyces spartinae]|uniref:LicD/FKTN/FKRP nucleotidyltransferase domain-containing protein n=1 Tax=Scheffersomyces spartinae TaxID=45513 RepID=A0A9P7VBK7_9ASCO|nr:uncharacterized protein KQ657_004476 [Scheffersomyces spartinae]KAG7194795.1 hypothetical protein KQ657_004476 [Scheffersomyces spartinae]
MLVEAKWFLYKYKRLLVALGLLVALIYLVYEGFHNDVATNYANQQLSKIGIYKIKYPSVKQVDALFENTENQYSNVLFSYLNSKKETGLPETVPFSWNQFLDLDSYFARKDIQDKLLKENSCLKLERHFGKPEAVSFNCKDEKFDNLIPYKINENIFLYLTADNRVLLKNLYLQTSAPNPASLVYLMDDLVYQFPVDPKSQLIKIEEPGSLDKNLDRFKTNFAAKFIHKPLADLFESKTLSKFDFSADWPEVLDFDAPKYFSEAYTLNEPKASAYDWRFFDHLQAFDMNQRHAILKRLMRGWSHFSQQFNIFSWINKESMVGWYWNGLNLPWTNDLDIQLSASEFDKLLKFNNTLVFDYNDSSKGHYNVFYLDINPYYSKIRGNNNNMVNARFIDVMSGVVMDVTVLILVEDFQGLMSSKSLTEKERARFKDLERKESMALYDSSYITYPVDQLSTFIPALFENEITYVPAKYEDIIQSKHKSLIGATALQGHKYRQFLRLWVNQENCKIDEKAIVSPSTKHDDEECKKNSQQVRELYEKTKKVTIQHFLELNNFEKFKDNLQNYKLSIPRDARRTF